MATTRGSACGSAPEVVLPGDSRLTQVFVVVSYTCTKAKSQVGSVSYWSPTDTVGLPAGTLTVRTIARSKLSPLPE